MPPLCSFPPSELVLRAHALTVDNDAQQEGDEEDEDCAHQSHAEPGELEVSTEPPACLPPELLACGRQGKRAEQQRCEQPHADMAGHSPRVITGP